MSGHQTPYLIIHNEQGNYKFPLETGNLWKIGRNEDNDLLLDDLSVSRYHAEIQREATGNFTITDLKSANGSYLNNQRINPHQAITLNNGEHLRLGLVDLSFYDAKNQELKQQSLKNQQSTIIVSEQNISTVVVFNIKEFTILSQRIDFTQFLQIIDNWKQNAQKILISAGSSQPQYISDFLVGIWSHQNYTITQQELTNIFQVILDIQDMTSNLLAKYAPNFHVNIGVGLNTGYLESAKLSDHTLEQDEIILRTFKLETAAQKINLDVGLGQATYDYLSELDFAQGVFKSYTIHLTNIEISVLIYGTTIEDLKNVFKQERLSGTANLFQQQAQQLADIVLTLDLVQLPRQFLWTFPLDLTSYPKLEVLESELQSKHNLETEIQASLEFMLGLRTQDAEQSRLHYERSLELYRLENNPEQESCLLYCLGLWWYAQAWQTFLPNIESLHRAKDYLQAAIDILGNQELTAKNAPLLSIFAEVLQNLQQWELLESLAEKLLTYYQNHPQLLKLAQACGFLAEIAISKANYAAAKEYANQALSLLPKQTSVSKTPITTLQNRYLLLLGKAEQGLGQLEDAIATLTKALNNCTFEHTYVYLLILQQLQVTHQQRQDYLSAFSCKQQQYFLEYKLGFRAFLSVNECNLPLNFMASIQTKLMTRFGNFGRQEEFNYLAKRIISNPTNIYLVYGEVTSGKSFYLKHCLIPHLKSQGVFTVYQNQYQGWSDILKENFFDTLNQESIAIDAVSLDYNLLQDSDSIIKQIHQQRQSESVVLIVFDQFEQFFRFNQEPKNIESFAIFVQKAILNPYLKIIFSFADSEMYHLLQIYNLTDRELTIDLKNIQSINLLSIANAKYVLDELLKFVPLELEYSLKQRLITDLATNSQTVNPLVLQIVGYQLETEQITTLQVYEQKGGKLGLLANFVESAIANCGTENISLAYLILYLLSNQKQQRTLVKSFSELQENLQQLNQEISTPKLIQIIQILVESRLIIKTVTVAGELYQLLTSDLIPFICEQKCPEILSQLQKPAANISIRPTEIHNAIKQIEATLQQQTSVAIGTLQSQITNNFYRIQKTYSLKGNANLKVAYSPIAPTFMPKPCEGGIIASASTDTTIKLWNLQGQGLLILAGHQAGVNAVAFSPILSPEITQGKGVIIASASMDGTVKLWNLQGQELLTLKGHQSGVNSVTFSPDGNQIVSASMDGTVKLWSLQGQELLTLKGHQSGINSVAFSPDGNSIASASMDTTIKLWNLQGQELLTLKGHQSGINSVVFSPDGNSIASASMDTTINIWNLQGHRLQTLRGHQGSVNSVVFDIEGKTLITSSWDQTMRLWSLVKTQTKVIQGHEDLVNTIAFSPDGQTLVSASNDHKVKLWNLQGQELLRLEGHLDWISVALFSPDGRFLVTASWDKTIRLWDVKGQQLRVLHHDDTVYCVAFSPDSRLFASGSMDKTIKLWNLEGEALKTMTGHESGVMSLAFSPDGQILASGSTDKTIKLWNLEGKELETIVAHDAAIAKICFSPDGRWLASASWDTTVKLWSMQPEIKLIRTFYHEDNVNCLAFSPDGHTIASASLDHSLKLWSWEGAQLQSFSYQDVINSVAFSPDGQTLAACDRSGRIILNPVMMV